MSIPAPLSTGKYKSVESQIYDYVVNTLGYNTAIACGILANAEYESGFNPSAVGDSGRAYGIFQWNSRRAELFQFTGTTAPSVRQQLDFMKHEFNNKEKAAWDSIKHLPNNATGAESAGRLFCTRYERPSNADSKGRERGATARDKYFAYYSRGGNSSVSSVTNIGSKIVEEARKHIGKPYKSRGQGPSEFDSAGFIYYCYNTAGYPVSYQTPSSYYYNYQDRAKSVNTSEVSAGDLLFYSDPVDGIYHVAIATGEGGRIGAKREDKEVIEYTTGLGYPSFILRLVSDTETSSDQSVGINPEDYVEDFTSLTVIDEYSLSIQSNLSRVTEEGYDYGYLIDLTQGEEFKFYIPEFQESAGSNWQDVDIIGRSVTIKAYSHTSSRSVVVNLDLYAGAGLYNLPGKDVVGLLHKDINFVKSLEYPDYSNPVVRPPSTVQLILGSSINIVGVVSDVVVDHLKPLDSQNRAMYVKLSFKVTQTAVNPPDYSDIRKGLYVLPSTENITSISDVNTNAPKYN